MSDHPSDTNENRFRATLAGALAFVSFGLVTALVLWVADLKAGADAAAEGIFTPEQIEQRNVNLSEVKKAQAELYDAEKVASTIKAMAEKPAKKAKASAIIVPGSETDLKNQAAAAAANAAKKAEEEAKAAEAPKEEGEKPAAEEGAKREGEKAAPKAEGKAKAKPKAEGKAKAKAKADKAGKGEPGAENQ